MEQTLLLNATYEPLKVVHWQKAITLWCPGKVEVISVYDREVRSVSFSIKLPAVIRLLRRIRMKRRFDYVPFSRANIYARDPMTMKAIRKTLAELAPGRIVIGLGVSHAHLVQKVRGHEYSNKPVATMRAYLEGMEKALYMGKEPAEEAPVVLAALRQNMLKLAAEKTRGAHPYFVTPEHTARARATLGPDAWLCPEQMVLLDTDPVNARAVARKHMGIYLGLPNYQNNLREYGFTDADFADGGSDRVVDAIVAWGDEAAIRARIKAHHDAGATHVCIQAFRPDGEAGPDLRALELLAPNRR